ncbi:hypothetical protein SprV_0301189800 [Sparganum proliferum]
MLVCQHNFCWKCLKKYMENDGRLCPVCRVEIKRDSDITRNLLLEQMLSEQNKGRIPDVPPDRPNNFIRQPNNPTKTDTIPNWLPIAGAAAASLLVGVGATLIGSSIARKSKK